VNAYYSLVVPDEEKAQRVLAALLPDDGSRPRLTMPQIENLTGLSPAQARRGWRLLRRVLQNVAVMEPHRQNSVYYLSEEFDDGTSYLFWQAKHLYTRVVSARGTVAQLRQVAESIPGVGPSLSLTEANLSGAWANLTQLVRTLADQLGVPVEEVERFLQRDAA
jgi:hypothetical protein